MWCKFSPCVQGCVSGFVPFFKFLLWDTLVISATQLSCPYRHFNSRVLSVRVYLFHPDGFCNDLFNCVVIFGSHPDVLRFSFNSAYLISDTYLNLPDCNLLVASFIGGYHFCVNLKFVGVSFLQLIFRGTRRFSVQPHPLPLS